MKLPALFIPMIRLSTINNKFVKRVILILVSVNVFYSNRKIPFNNYAREREEEVLHWKPAHPDEDTRRTSNNSGYNEHESSALSYQFPIFHTLKLATLSLLRMD